MKNFFLIAIYFFLLGILPFLTQLQSIENLDNYIDNEENNYNLAYFIFLVWFQGIILASFLLVYIYSFTIIMILIYLFFIPSFF